MEVNNIMSQLGYSKNSNHSSQQYQEICSSNSIKRGLEKEILTEVGHMEEIPSTTFQGSFLGIPKIKQDLQSCSSLNSHQKEPFIKQSMMHTTVREENSEEESEDIYDVERIEDVQVIQGEEHYLVKWEGYPSSQNTWEPLSSFGDNLTLINEFIRDRNKELIDQSLIIK